MTDFSGLFRLDGKQALVSGAGRGIGLMAAKALAAFGAEVTLISRSRSEIEAAASDIRASGGSARFHAIDALDVDAVGLFVEDSGPFDILFNNAGTNRPKPFPDVTAEDFDAVFDLNVRAAFFMAQAVARGLIAAGRPGSIINVSSQMGHVGGAERTIYCASKFAIEGLTKAMAIDLAAHQIRVNTLCPTFIETPLTAPYFKDEAFREKVLSKIKLGRVGQVEDLAGALILLASDASSLMTGSSVLVDGGWTAE